MPDSREMAVTVRARYAALRGSDQVAVRIEVPELDAETIAVMRGDGRLDEWRPYRHPLARGCERG